MYATILAGVLALADPSAQVDLSGSTIVFRADSPELERFAALELRRYLSQLAGKVIPISNEGRLPEGIAVVVGSAGDAVGEPAKVPETLGEEGFLIKVAGQVLILRGVRPVGTLYAVYELLERLGMGFYLGGDAYPEIPAPLRVPGDLSRECRPAFAIRGSLPWYNFLNSPTTWNREDFKSFFDQMSKMKMNFVGFHTYDHEPFGAYRDETGKLVMGGPLKTSLNYDWGAAGPLKTDDFGWGTGRYFDREVFGSHATTDAKNDEDAVLRAERDLREGLAYARSRGLHVCVGFELVGNPYDPVTAQRFRRRFADLLSDYPMIDHVWVWQSEGLGGGSEAWAPGTPARARMEELRPVFAYLGNEKRIGEASRMTDYVLLAHRVLRQLAPDKRMIVSGWGGDQWMRFSDFYIGFDKVLPKDIVFAALDNIDPSVSPFVSHVYGKVSSDRQRWPIPWFESDGGGSRRDQWGPQPNVKPFTHLLRDALKKGAQGVLGIHWRTRGVEEVAAYTAQFAWEPELTYEGFYDRFAETCFGATYGKEMGTILRELESMGSRWSGTCGQVECGGFQWASDGKRPDSKKLARLDEIAKRVEEILHETLGVENSPSDIPPPFPTSRFVAMPMTRVERLNYLLTTIRWLTRYDRAIDRFLPGGPVESALSEAAQAREEGRKADAEKAAMKAWEQVRTSGFGEAIRTYGLKLASRCDFGVLATVNVKAVVTYRKLVDRIAEFLPVGPPLEPQYHRGQNAILLSWRPGARAARYSVLAEPVGGQAIRVEGLEGCSGRLEAGFRGTVHIRGISRDGVEGPPSEPLMIPDPVCTDPTVRTDGTCPPIVAMERPSTSFAAGESLPVRAVIGSETEPVSAKVHYHFGRETSWSTLPMACEFRNAHRVQIPLPAAPMGSAPLWVEYLVSVQEASGGRPCFDPKGVSYSATVEPRPFARVWQPVSDTPPVAGRDWPVVMRVVVDGAPEGVSVVLKVEGGPEIKAEPMPHGSFKAVVPGGAIRDPELRIAATISRPGSEEVRSPVWVLRTDAEPPSGIAGLEVQAPRRYQAVLKWGHAEDDTGVVSYKITKDGRSVGETALSTWFDAQVPAGSSPRYGVIPVDGAGRIGKAVERVWKAPDWPPPQAPEALEAREGFGLVVLKWKTSEDDVAFQVLRADAQDGPYGVVSGDRPIRATEFVDHPPKAGQSYWWQVVAVDPLGKPGRPSHSVAASAKPVPTDPILVADFDTPQGTGKLHGGAKLGAGKKGHGLHLTAGGWSDFPDRPEYDDLVEFTLTLWIKPETLDPMPVFVSHGFWGQEGIFLQFLGHRVRAYIGGGRVTDGGSPVTGRWQHVAVVRSGDQLTTYLDGRPVVRGRFPPTPVGVYRAPLRIGQYMQPAPEYQTKGVIDEVKLYLRPLSEQEIRADAAP